MWSSGILSALLVKDYIITALGVNNIGFIGTVLSQKCVTNMPPLSKHPPLNPNFLHM